MKAKELRQKKTEELETMLRGMKGELLKLNGKLSSGTQLEKPKRVRELKKDIARSLLILQEKTSEVSKK